MMTYENLLTNAISDVPAFAKEYQRLMDADMIDSNTGNHIVFGYAFTPVLIGAINATEKSVVRGMLAFLEKMASSDDVRVVEVCDQSVLEELNDEVDWKDLRGFIGPKTKEGLVAIKEYMYWSDKETAMFIKRVDENGLASEEKMELRTLEVKDVDIMTKNKQIFRGFVGDYIEPIHNENGIESIVVDDLTRRHPVELCEEEIKTIDIMDYAGG